MYTYVVENIDRFMIFYTEEDKLKDPEVIVGAFKKYDFGAIIAEALKAFIETHDDISKNVLDSYEIFFSQKQAESFEGCASLEYFSVPSSVKRLGVSVCKGNTALKKVEFNAPLLTLPAYSFSNCSSLSDVFPQGYFLLRSHESV